ncbi:hypothetical protein HanXRQr2_Chr15g0715361 [Helianthus annuus]|uniref:Uncharacterized protein n=1 Tax=Helianthus annuus TaxID=4232 RepID=A0A251SBG0_HELAN|nr:hypothetical protein HanXRQr2_Chr15g0715361 [Helianthus annuus]KAJ0833099.1 hypothetical protein HanPSC8_Chr15g0686411 [Helianthus annuus]
MGDRTSAGKTGGAGDGSRRWWGSPASLFQCIPPPLLVSNQPPPSFLRSATDHHHQRRVVVSDGQTARREKETEREFRERGNREEREKRWRRRSGVAAHGGGSGGGVSVHRASHVGIEGRVAAVTVVPSGGGDGSSGERRQWLGGSTRQVHLWSGYACAAISDFGSGAESIQSWFGSTQSTLRVDWSKLVNSGQRLSQRVSIVRVIRSNAVKVKFNAVNDPRFGSQFRLSQPELTQLTRSTQRVDSVNSVNFSAKRHERW